MQYNKTSVIYRAIHMDATLTASARYDTATSPGVCAADRSASELFFSQYSCDIAVSQQRDKAVN